MRELLRQFFENYLNENAKIARSRVSLYLFVLIPALIAAVSSIIQLTAYLNNDTAINHRYVTFEFGRITTLALLVLSCVIVIASIVRGKKIGAFFAFAGLLMFSYVAFGYQSSPSISEELPSAVELQTIENTLNDNDFMIGSVICRSASVFELSLFFVTFIICIFETISIVLAFLRLRFSKVNSV